MTLRIRIEHGQNAGKAWRLAKEGVYVLGRVPSAAIHVLDMKVSADHCQFHVRGEGNRAETVLKDSGSRHGTLLNGQPVATRKRLKPGDEIRVGLSILRILSDDPDAEEAVPTGQAEKEAAGADKAAGTPKKKRKTFPADALTGTEVGGYKVIEKIGQGGMGSVYTAEQLSLNREVAFKVLSEKFTSDSAFVDQFVNEARSAAALNHPNVVQVYDVGRENGRYYFSMEFVPGGSLEERLAESGPQDWREALNWMIDASNALIFAQKREILHRDVKPDNLMLAEDGSAKLCDLGLAKKASNEDMLAAGIIGTPAFIAPEAIRRRKDIDVRSDLYSLGCTFYRLLTGENPYPAKTVKEILMGHLKAPVPRVSTKKPNVPRDIDDVIFKLMQKEPGERYESPQDLLQSLDKIRVQHGLEAHGLRPASRKPLIIALVAVLVVGGAGLAYLLSQGGTTVTVADKEAEKRNEELRAKIEKDAYDDFVREGEKAKGDLDLREARGNLYFGDNWAKDSWRTLIADYESFANDLLVNTKYGARDEVKDLAAEARAAGKKIKKYVELRRGADETVKTARTTNEAEFKTWIEKVAADFNAALKTQDWVKAWHILDLETIESRIKHYVELQVVDVLPEGMSDADRAQFEGSLLLDGEEHVQPLVKRLLPGDPVGEDLRNQVIRRARLAHGAFRKQVNALLSEKTEASYADAQAKVEAYAEALPETVDVSLGDLAGFLETFTTEAKDFLTTIRDGKQALASANLSHDQLAFSMLLKALRSPKGLLFRFRFDEAQKLADTAAKGMILPGYQRLSRQVAEDVAAYAHVFDRLVSTYPDGWSKDRVYWTDERGRDQSEKAKAITNKDVKLGSEVVTFETLGPAWLLQNLFRDKDGNPRFACEGEDHRGLAILAEMAVDFDHAQTRYQAYLAWLPADRAETQQALRERMGQKLQLERQAGEAWKIAHDNLAKVGAILDAIDPAMIGEDAFWDDKPEREAFIAKKREMSELLLEARRAQQTLQDPRYTTTVWGTAVLDHPRAGIPYAGEPPVPVDGPEGPEDDEDAPPDAPGDGEEKDPPKDGDAKPPEDADSGKAPDDEKTPGGGG